MIQAVQATDATADFHSLRLKEAVYKAAGLGAYDLYDEVDYDTWYSTQLINELRIQDPRYKIVRHRVVWLLGNWVGVKMSSSLRPSLYSVLSQVLQPTEELAIRLTASESLQYAIDDFSFSVEEFSPVSCLSTHILLLAITWSSPAVFGGLHEALVPAAA